MTIPRRMPWLLEQISQPIEGCLIWPFSCTNNGYAAMSIGGKLKYVHRFVCERTNGPAPDGYQAAHECGNQRCVNPAHISWKTPRDNQLDRERHGTKKIGFRSLTAQAVAEIKALNGRVRRCDLATRFGVTEATIRQIHTGKTWRHVEPAHSTFAN